MTTPTTSIPASSTLPPADASQPARTSDEFYIGYEGGMPAGIRRVVRPAVAVIFLVALVAGALVTFAQRPLANATFEFGQPRTLEGWLTKSPAPSLLVRQGERWIRYWLVSRGKFGAERDIDPDGWVRLDATRIIRDGWRMLEMVPETMSRVARSDAPPQIRVGPSTPFRARGEIVDSKCYLGVMNPGERTVHRDCAVRCLSGGIPAMFAYRAPDGSWHLALLVRDDGRRVGHDVASLAGLSRELQGHLYTTGGIEVLVLPQ